MTSAVQQDIDTEIEIQKTLISINDVAVKIKRELDTINELVKETGPLPMAMAGANETLRVVAEDMGIKVDELRRNDEESPSGLPTNLAVPDLLQKLLSCVDT